MSRPPYIVVGRSRDCELVLEDASVSGRHARLSWKDGRILVEDLGSANGTWVRGKKVEQAIVRPGEDVRFGSASIPWSDPRVRPFLRAGARGDTMIGTPLPGRRFICGACGARGLMPDGFRKGGLKCGVCAASLVVGRSRRGVGWLAVASAAMLLVVAGVGWAVTGSSAGATLEGAAERLGIRSRGDSDTRSPQEASIRAHTVPLVVAAIDPTHRITRTEAVTVAADEQGPYHVEQVARLWTHVRGRWRYVNDPRGGEYFATASETIDNGYAGDCDDFAIVLIAMIASIGGDARLVMMDGPNGGHAYAEACIRESPEEAARRLSRHYRRSWDRYLGRQRVDQIHFRSSPGCNVWLNLDWNAGVPGGPYGGETWAVGIYPDGRTETLAPSPGPAGHVAPPSTGTGSSALPPARP